MKKKTAIVTGGTKNQFPAMAVLALNIADKCPNVADELIIYHDGVPVEEQEKVKNIFPTRFIEYKSPFLENTKFKDVVTKYFSLMVFCKYECWRLLDEYETVIWTDYDIVLLQDIYELKENNGNVAKFCKSKYLVKKFERSLFDDFEKDLSSFNVFGDGICCPLFVLHDTFPDYTNFYNKCIELTNYYSTVLFLPEEAIISILFQQYKIVYDELDPDIYITKPSEYEIKKDNSKILHAVGQPKFWNGLKNEKWEYYYNIWKNEYHGIEFITEKKIKKITIKKLFKFFVPYGIIRLYQIIKYK